AIAGIVLGLVILVAGGASVLIYLGPGVKTKQLVEVSFGPGAFVIGAAVLARLIGSAMVVTTRPQPFPLKSHLPPPGAGRERPPGGGARHLARARRGAAPGGARPGARARRARPRGAGADQRRAVRCSAAAQAALRAARAAVAAAAPAGAADAPADARAARFRR